MLKFPISCLPAVIPVGVQTEGMVTEIGFDCAAWLKAWPDIKLSVWPTRPGESAAYPAQSRMDGTVLVWQVSGYDTEKTGNGKVEIFGFTPDGKRKLSGDGCHTSIRATTLATTKEPGEAEKPWVEDVLNAADRAEEAAKRAENALIFGEEHAGKLVYISTEGKMIPLALGDGLEIVDGVLRVTYQPVKPEDEIIFVDRETGVVEILGADFVDQADSVILMNGVEFIDKGTSVVLMT